MTETVAPSTPVAARWRMALRTGNPPAGPIDPITRWLVLTRAAVLPMTISAGAIAGLLAVGHPEADWGLFSLAFVGIVLAHMSNNLMNDLYDADVGLDTADYPRALYAPHPILSGLITRKGLITAALVVNLLDLAIGVWLFVERGWPIVAFALGGFLLSVAYTAPPLRLKKHGLGELDVAIVWGPLMVGGTYYAAVGEIPWLVVLASIPYALLCVAVLMGKHVDKLEWDEREGVRTLPVILGEPVSRTVTRGLLAAFYVGLIAAVAAGALPWPALLGLAAFPSVLRPWKALGYRKPKEPPAGFPVWPLWFAPLTFLHTRRAGGLLVLGLIVAAIAGIEAPGL
jgi:1,4-dihydroxy-2-naphthoate polyprenyltransferase